MARWIAGDDIPEGGGRCCEVDGRLVAIVKRDDGTCWQMEGACPCADNRPRTVSLGEYLATCPHREWRFDPRTGPCHFSPASLFPARTVTTQRRFWEAGPETEIELH
jgi:nitrite reductase/ring-hydroxylating ferredoxin subunit